ncbi:MAG: ATP-binding protein [Gammaproteobacteria bacterium]|nr:ATP-binding protein [Gammaproteobacteria bacterium]
MGTNNMALQLPLGYDDFREIVENKLDFVDKTLFIKEVLDDYKTKVTVITRPRRFGKTLNLSMLRYFLAGEVDSRPTKGLFDNLKIAKVKGNYLTHQGQYPVIFVTFKDIKTLTFKDALEHFQILVQNLFRGYRYVIESHKVGADEKKMFQQLLAGECSQSLLEQSLKFLSELLYKHHGKKVYILVDEYDTPIQSSYVNNYYDEMINFTRGLLGTALKTNTYLERAVITGVIRVAKESLFSGLNNITIYSVLHTKYSEYFGFTEKEVSDLLVQAKMTDRAEEIRNWYNGYQFGNTVIYNPWSIVNCINENSLQPFWVNTSDSALIRDLVIRASVDFKSQIEELLQNRTIAHIIDEHVVFGDLKNNPGAIWSLLVTSGYLKVLNPQLVEDGWLCTLAIPNQEIYQVYRSMIKRWLSEGRDIEWYNNFLQDLLTGNIDGFAKRLEHIMQQIVSYHDIAKEPEGFYHGLMLGFTASLNKEQYEIKSNRESGNGRFDILIAPKNLEQLGIIIELKSEKIPKISSLKKAAKKALSQIEKKNYIAEFLGRGLTRVMKIGIAFCGKEFALEYKLFE